MSDALYPNDDAALPARSVAYTGTAGATGTWPAGPNEVLVWATTDCYVKVGVNVTADTTSMPLPAYTPVKIRVPPASSSNQGGPWRVSAVQISAGGTVYAKPLSA